MFGGIIKSKSKTFLTFCFCFLTGITIGSLINQQIDFVYIYLALFILISFLVIYWKNKSVRFVILSLLIVLFGFARYAYTLPQNVEEDKKIIIGLVSTEPDVRADSVRYILETSDVEGKIHIKSDLYPRFEYGDRLEVKCKLNKPEPIENFRYDMYLARFGVFSICSDPKIKKIGEGKGSFVLQNIFTLKDVIADRVNQLWHEPYAGFMAGLLYGYRGGLGSLNELFNITGVTHIIAISGYNISIIAAILITICVHILIPRKKAFWLVSTGIVLFVIFAGASGSVVRAGIMGIIVLYAKQIGRMSRVGNVMAFTAVIMCVQNPYVLIWDAGFQLSFIATIGLVYLAPVIEKYFKKVPEVIGLKESFISTISAIVATLPLILYQFGRLSIVAPIVNVLILWTIPWLMLGGFATLIFSFLYFPLAKALAWVVWVGMRYVVFVVKKFAGLEFASTELHISFLVMILFYLVIYFVCKVSSSKEK